MLLFLLNDHTPTSEHTPTSSFVDNSAPQLSEKEIDDFFNSAYEELHHDNNENQQTVVNNVDADNAVKRPSKASRNFGKPVSHKDISEAMQRAVPLKTQRDNKYCANLWEDWVLHRAKTTGVTIPYLNTIKVEELQQWLCAFVLEIRKKDGSVFLPNSLHHVCCGIMRYVRVNDMPGIDFFKDEGFSQFRMVLDSEMKRLQAAGIGIIQKKAEPITFEEEEILWEKGILGDATPQSLLDTMLYMNGLYFALRGGKEHRILRHKPSQIQLIEKHGERPYLMYTEDLSKNHPGGLKGRKIKPKVVYHHANIEKPERCFVRLYKLYNSRCPPNRPDNAYYLQPNS